MVMLGSRCHGISVLDVWAAEIQRGLMVVA